VGGGLSTKFREIMALLGALIVFCAARGVTSVRYAPPLTAGLPFA